MNEKNQHRRTDDPDSSRSDEIHELEHPFELDDEELQDVAGGRPGGPQIPRFDRTDPR